MKMVKMIMKRCIVKTVFTLSLVVLVLVTISNLAFASTKDDEDDGSFTFTIMTDAGIPMFAKTNYYCHLSQDYATVYGSEQITLKDGSYYAQGMKFQNIIEAPTLRVKIYSTAAFKTYLHDTYINRRASAPDDGAVYIPLGAIYDMRIVNESDRTYNGPGIYSVRATATFTCDWGIGTSDRTHTNSVDMIVGFAIKEGGKIR